MLFEYDSAISKRDTKTSGLLTNYSKLINTHSIKISNALRIELRQNLPCNKRV